MREVGVHHEVDGLAKGDMVGARVPEHWGVEFVVNNVACTPLGRLADECLFTNDDADLEAEVVGLGVRMTGCSGQSDTVEVVVRELLLRVRKDLEDRGYSVGQHASWGVRGKGFVI